MGYNTAAAMIALSLLLAIRQQDPSTQDKPPAPVLLGKCAYLMTGSNKGKDGMVQYQAKANDEVWQDPKGHNYDSFVWSDLTRNGKRLELPSGDPFTEILTLDPTYRPPSPDLTKAPPALMGPITDLMTFYVDARLGMNLDLVKAGSHAYVRYGRPSSWADGSHVILGQDAIDFDVQFKGVDRKTNQATLLVKHVPSVESSLSLPADWMREPVDKTPNNWVQVEKTEGGKFVAGAGKETFDVTL